uniref:Variant surface glycoprotein 1125.1093 n=1 Tax=Trypanosoma brucei TaxID=5691 RepID=A0A1J0R686_9TRYP|nr:variant surface glycoprotein 1125.1093 [Trypanosoma brucei]
MYFMPKTVLSICYVALALAAVPGAAVEATAVGKVTTVCREITYVGGLARNIEDKLKTAATGIKALADELKKLEFGGACADNNNKRTAFTALANYARGQLTSSINNLAENPEPLVTAAANLRAREAMLKTAKHLLGGKPGAATAGATFEENTGYLEAARHQICTIKLQNMASNGDVCDDDKAEDDAINRGYSELHKTKTFNLLQDTAFASIKSEAKTHTHGSSSLITAAGSGGTFCGTNNDATLLNAANAVAIESLTITQLPNPSQQSLYEADGTTCIKTSGDEQRKLMTVKKTANAICQAKQINLHVAKPLATLTIGELKADPEFLNIIRTLTGTAEHKDNDEQVAKKTVNSLLGADEAKVSETFIEKLSDTTLGYKLSGQDVEIKGSSISASTQVGTHIAYCIERNQKALRAQVSTANPPTSSKQAEDCEEEKDKDKCNEKDGCKYNEKNSKCEEDPKKLQQQRRQPQTQQEAIHLLFIRPLFC